MWFCVAGSRGCSRVTARTRAVASHWKDESRSWPGLLRRARQRRGTAAAQVAYVPQAAFIYNATVRENILFGLPYEEQRYQRALQAASLGPDLLLLTGARRPRRAGRRRAPVVSMLYPTHALGGLLCCSGQPQHVCHLCSNAAAIRGGQTLTLIPQFARRRQRQRCSTTY